MFWNTVTVAITQHNAHGVAQQVRQEVVLLVVLLIIYNIFIIVVVVSLFQHLHDGVPVGKLNNRLRLLNVFN